MKNATMQLFEIMLYNKECADFIQNEWKALYNDIIENAGTGVWDKLDPISAMALDDWYTRGEE